MNSLLEAIIKKAEGEIAVAKGNISVYLRNPTAIGDHPNIVEAIETQIDRIAEAHEKIETIKEHFS
ncbi:hypothetical protein [Phenylobacterium sp.]|jgi:hypothetical protein|uniref:hypothetical protein n=1 Tax=Phenylobacterium sp. TaxID=1871053 RepID=UPI000C92B328|nr:hypothetical protein [Phenylobacterium sp.]MAK80306.1 hypothetical protein [Phenylobacterium sp.]